MAKNDSALFEELVNGDATAESILDSFSKKQIHIVSPSVSGLLESFTFKSKNSLGISACGTGFEADIINGTSVDTTIGLSLGGTDDADNNSSKTPDFSISISEFLEKVKNTRSAFLPSLFLSGSATLAADSMQQMESYENTFMRMLGMPDDTDVKNGGGDISSLVFYIDPSDGGYSGKLMAAPLSEIAGLSNNSNSPNSSILLERQKSPGSAGRKYNFTSTSPQYISMDDLAKILEDGLSLSEATVVTNVSVNYYEPNDLMKFFYLKIVPIQDARIYGCISEPTKIISKPFDINSGSKVDGNVIHTSLLETIIRVRLDRVTGSPGIYSSDTSKNDGFTTGLIAPKNTGDEITQVECFLIEKLKKILFQLSDKHVRDSISINEEIAAEEVERNTEEAANTNSNVSPVSGGFATMLTAASQQASFVGKELKQASTLQNLKILKAREDAILFLLKDTSSSSDSLNLQTGTIRIASGFQDILSGPLFSLISQRSIFLGKKIDELNSIIEASDKTEPIDMKKRADPGSSRSDKVTFEYLGVSAEDFLIYMLALLSIDQDYLIGLLSKERRLNMANIISISAFPMSSSKDPYGLIERINKSDIDGGFPSVIDSVNALSLLVYSLYVKYIELIKLDVAPREDELYEMWKEYIAKEEVE